MAASENPLNVETDATETALKRLRWRCRRGMLEMDLLLEQFIAAHYPKLTTPQQLAFDALLDLPDHQLWAMVMNENQQNVTTHSSDTKSVIHLLQSCNLLATQER